MTTKEQLQETLKAATESRKKAQKLLDNAKKLGLTSNWPIAAARVKKFRKIIQETRMLIKSMPKGDLQKPAVMERPEFKEKFREAVGVQKEAIEQIRLDTIADLDKAWPNIKGKSIAIEAPDEVKEELMRRWRKEFPTIKVDGYRPVKMND
jgi:hypothetical protein